MQPKQRHSKGTVAIIVSNNRLQLRFNHLGKRYYLSLLHVHLFGEEDLQVVWIGVSTDYTLSQDFSLSAFKFHILLTQKNTILVF